LPDVLEHLKARHGITTKKTKRRKDEKERPLALITHCIALHAILGVGEEE